MFYHCTNKSREPEVCRREYFHICIYIIASTSHQIPQLSGTFNLNFQDFPGPKSFSSTFQAWKSYKKSRTFQEAWESCSKEMSACHVDNQVVCLTCGHDLYSDACYTAENNSIGHFTQTFTKHCLVIVRCLTCFRDPLLSMYVCKHTRTFSPPSSFPISNYTIIMEQ